MMGWIGALTTGPPPDTKTLNGPLGSQKAPIVPNAA